MMMMMKAVTFSPCSTSAVIYGAKRSKKVDLGSSNSRRICCCTRKSDGGGYQLPKLESFSRRTRFDRVVKDPPLIEKSENELADYCSTLEGDASYSCWRAYFELKELERESPKADVERLILQAGGLKSLIGCVHGITAIHKAKKGSPQPDQVPQTEEKVVASQCRVPDGLPKSQKEMEEEERDRMPDSPFTRLLRARGKFPAWYSPAPDHEN